MLDVGMPKRFAIFSIRPCEEAALKTPCKHSRSGGITMRWRSSLLFLAFLGVAAPLRADLPENPATYVKEHYSRKTHQIPMRDGVKLMTVVYSPKDTSQTYPMIMMRTPY